MSAPLEAKTYLAERGVELHEQLTRVGQRLSENDLPDVRRDADKVRITHLEAEIPEGVEELARKAYAKVRPIKITQLLVEIDQVTHFSRHGTHLHRGDPARDREALFAAMLAEATNLGLAKRCFSIDTDESRIVRMLNSSDVRRDSIWWSRPLFSGIRWNWHERLGNCNKRGWSSRQSNLLISLRWIGSIST